MARVDESPLILQLRRKHQRACLSLYVPAGPGFEVRYWEGQLKDAYSSIDAILDEEQRLGLRREIEVVRSFFQDPDHRPTEIALAVFSCEPDGFFEARRLPEDVGRLLVYFDDHFELEPLLAQMERWPPTVVAVVEKDQVRLFTAFLDDVEEVGHHKMAIDIRRDDLRGQSEQFEREEGTGVRLNLKEAVQWLESQHLQRQGYTSLYLAGPVQACSQFKHLLPQPWRQALRGEFGVTLDIGDAELAMRIRQELHQLHRAEAG